MTNGNSQLPPGVEVGAPQANPNQVTATPNLYIDVVMPNGQKTVYDLGTARAVRDALDGALQAFDATLAQAQAAAQDQTPPAQDDQSENSET